MKNKHIYLLLILFLLGTYIHAEVSMPGIFSNNMVIQRDKPVTIWGWAGKNEKVEVSFNGQTATTKGDAKGRWKVSLKPMVHGGPYVMTVKGKGNTVTFDNVLIGDVWLCSGQSNMEWKVKDANNAGMEISNANYPNIRSFNVARDIRLAPSENVKGDWAVCSPATVGSFSAVGYFFARKLYQETKIPIGIINSSWGGTDIETWISGDRFDALPQEFKARYKTKIGSDMETFIKENEAKKAAYLKMIDNEAGMSQQWFKPSTDISTWQDIKVPAAWSATAIGDVDGVVWFRKEVNIPKEMIGSTARIHLSKIDDDDIVWINGVKVGETKNYNAIRVYDIPKDMLVEGKNTIVVRIVDNTGEGGFYGLADDMYLEAENRKLPLAGIWKYKESVINNGTDYVEVSPNMAPSLLFNGMINPITQFAIKGAIWYQGENNSNMAVHYQTLFPTLINNWRKQWGDEFPFYWVQLANYMNKDTQPQESRWAELREAQTMTLSTPKTGQAVIIDIGEGGDIHPRNKQDVGLRLALHALHNDYGRSEVVCQSPIFGSMQIEGGKAVITFDQIGSGLEVRNKHGYIEGFAIAGADNKFVWAKAYLKDNKVIVYSHDVANPVAVRYAWSNNPDTNLYSKEGLPATPFRTDNQPNK